MPKAGAGLDNGRVRARCMAVLSTTALLVAAGAVPAAATTWYLAEGCTAPGFETWILIQNP